MKRLLFTALIVVLTSCNGIQKPDDFDKSRVVAEARQMLFDYHTDIGTEGLRAEFKYLDKSPDFFWVPPGYETPLDYDSVQTILERNAKSFQSVKFEWKTLKIYPLTHEIANFSGIVTGQMADSTGTTSNVSIIESGTLIKRKDGWKLLSGQSALLEGEPKDSDLP